MWGDDDKPPCAGRTIPPGWEGGLPSQRMLVGGELEAMALPWGLPCVSELNANGRRSRGVQLERLTVGDVLTRLNTRVSLVKERTGFPPFDPI